MLILDIVAGLLHEHAVHVRDGEDAAGEYKAARYRYEEAVGVDHGNGDTRKGNDGGNHHDLSGGNALCQDRHKHRADGHGLHGGQQIGELVIVLCVSAQDVGDHVHARIAALQVVIESDADEDGHGQKEVFIDDEVLELLLEGNIDGAVAGCIRQHLLIVLGDTFTGPEILHEREAQRDHGTDADGDIPARAGKVLLQHVGVEEADDAQGAESAGDHDGDRRTDRRDVVALQHVAADGGHHVAAEVPQGQTHSGKQDVKQIEPDKLHHAAPGKGAPEHKETRDRHDPRADQHIRAEAARPADRLFRHVVEEEARPHTDDHGDRGHDQIGIGVVEHLVDAQHVHVEQLPKAKQGAVEEVDEAGADNVAQKALLRRDPVGLDPRLPLVAVKHTPL